MNKLEKFKEEKRKYLSKGGLEINLGSIDTNILGLIVKTNQLGFVYTFSQSCSGVPLDHKGKLVNYLKWYEDMEGNPPDQKTPSGYLLLRCFTEEGYGFSEFSKKINQIPNTVFTEIKKLPFKTERVDYIKSFLMQMKFNNKEEPALRWQQYHRIINDFD